MDRVLRSAARARERRRTGEAGFTMVEVLVAILLLAVALTALAQLAGSQMVASLRNRIRQVAISYVNQELESLRSMTYTRLGMDPSDNTVPATKTVGSTTYSVFDGSSGCASNKTCLTYQKTVNLSNNQVSGNNFTFTETRWIGQASGAAYKTAFVTLTATSGPSFTYSAQTDVSGATTNNPTAVTALQVDLEQVTSAGAVVTDPTTGNAEVPPDGFNVTVTSGGTTVASGTTTDGAWSVTSGVSANTSYTCTVTTGASTPFSTWTAYSASDASFTCATGAAGTTATFTSRWQQAGCTYNSSADSGYLTATVFNSSGSPLNNVKITLTQVQGQKNPPAITTGSNGQASLNGTPAGNVANSGLYTVSLSGGGPPAVNQAKLASVCIWPDQTTQLVLFGLGSNPPGSGAITLTVPVENTYPGGTATIAVEAVDTTGTYKGETQVDLDGCGSSCTATNVVVQAFKNFSYNVSVNCVGVGGAAPIGSTDGPTVQDGEPLATWSTGNVTGNTTDATTAAVKCPQS